MDHIEIIQLLVKHLPDNNAHENDPSWGYAWDELSGEAQEAVKNARRIAWEFVSEHQLEDLTE